MFNLKSLWFIFVSSYLLKKFNYNSKSKLFFFLKKKNRVKWTLSSSYLALNSTHSKKREQDKYHVDNLPLLQMCKNLLGRHGHVIVKCTVDACNVPINQWSIQRLTEAYNRQHSRKKRRLKKNINDDFKFWNHFWDFTAAVLTGSCSRDSISRLATTGCIFGA